MSSEGVEELWSLPPPLPPPPHLLATRYTIVYQILLAIIIWYTLHRPKAIGHVILGRNMQNYEPR